MPFNRAIRKQRVHRINIYMFLGRVHTHTISPSINNLENIFNTPFLFLFGRCCSHDFFHSHELNIFYQLHTAYWTPYLSELDSINTFYRFTAVFIDIITAESFFSRKAQFNGIAGLLANCCEFGDDENIFFWKMLLSTSIVLNNILLCDAYCVFWKTFLIIFDWAKMAKSKRAQIQFIFICLSVFGIVKIQEHWNAKPIESR